jgi:hypothetical protein
VGRNWGGHLAFCHSTGVVSGTESNSGLAGHWGSGSVTCPILLVLVKGVLLRFRAKRSSIQKLDRA